MGLLDGQVALITGGARGQGRAHALTCAREGADVAVFDIAAQIPTVPYPLAEPADLDETRKEVERLDRRALTIEGDARSQEALDSAVQRTLAEFGRLDILIVNHGIWSPGAFWELTTQQWDDMLAVNLTGVWRAVKAVAPHMIEQGHGSVVITSSMNGLEPGAGYAHYSTAKAGTIGLMRNLALELAPHGVRCNSVAPGVIETPMLDNDYTRGVFTGRPDGTLADLRVTGSHYRALRGVGLLPAQAVADAALWLNSGLASTITGVTVPVDAGHSLLPGFNHAPAPGSSATQLRSTPSASAVGEPGSGR